MSETSRLLKKSFTLFEQIYTVNLLIFYGSFIAILRLIKSILSFVKWIYS